MPLVPAADRQAAVQILQDAERVQGIRVVHAFLSPALENGHYGDAGAAAYDLKVAFVRQPDAYMGIDHHLEISQAQQMIPGTQTRMKAMDLRDAFAQSARNPVMMMQAALSLYASALVDEPLVKTDWPGLVAGQLSAVGPQTRQSMAEASEMFANASLMRAQAPGVDREEAAPYNALEAGAFFGAAPTPAVPVDAGVTQTYFAKLALAAMAMRATLATQALPPPERLDFPQDLQQRGVQSLRDLLNNPPNTQRIMEIATVVRDYALQNAPRQNNVAQIFGGNPAEGPRQAAPAPEGLREWAAAVNRGLQGVIRDAQPALAGRQPADLAVSAIVNGNLHPVDPERQMRAIGHAAPNFGPG